MTGQDKKAADYHRQWERKNNISLWFALAIVIVPVIGLGVFLAIENNSAGREPARFHLGVGVGTATEVPSKIPK
jgi:hypothetical protein